MVEVGRDLRRSSSPAPLNVLTQSTFHYIFFFMTYKDVLANSGFRNFVMPGLHFLDSASRCIIF